MNGWGVSRGGRLVLLGLGLLAGLFVMHGLTASPSPVHVSEPAMAAYGAGGLHGMGHGAPENADRATVASPMDKGGHMAGCLAGAICFALLTVVLALALTLARAVGGPVVRPGAGQGAVSWRGPPRARPPTIYQLSVMRV